MSILTTVDEIKKYIPTTVTVDVDQLMPFINNQAIAQRLRKNILGNTLYDSLLADYKDDNIEAETIKMGLLTRCQLYVAHYALLRSIPTGIVNISASGINQTVSDSIKPLSQSQIDMLIDSETVMCDEALEDLLIFLEENIADFTDWKDAPSYTIIKEAYLPSATKFTEQYSIAESRSTYLAIKSFMLEVQRIQIKAVLTSELYDAMAVKIEDNSFSEPELVLIPWIKKAIAYLTIYKSIPHLAVHVTNEGVQVYTRPERTNTKAKITADALRLEDLKESCESQGEYYLGLIRDYLKANASEFPEYPQDSVASPTTGKFTTQGKGNITLL
jgi:hypothetical protein